MVASDKISDVASVHRILLDALARLEKNGRHAAAAHLLAAIELIENDIERDSAAADAIAESPHAVIARVMIETFGDRAEAVARGQLAAARGPSMLAWAAIINRIG